MPGYYCNHWTITLRLSKYKLRRLLYQLPPQQVDLLSTMEREHGFTDEQADIMQYQLRQWCLERILLPAVRMKQNSFQKVIHALIIRYCDCDLISVSKNGAI